MPIWKLHFFPRFCKQNIIEQDTVSEFLIFTNQEYLERPYSLKASYVIRKDYRKMKEEDNFCEGKE